MNAPIPNGIGWVLAVALSRDGQFDIDSGDEQHLQEARSRHAELAEVLEQHANLSASASDRVLLVAAGQSRLPLLLSFIRQIGVHRDRDSKPGRLGASGGLSYGPVRDLTAADGRHEIVGLAAERARLLAHRGTPGTVLSDADTTTRLADHEDADPQIGSSRWLVVRGDQVGTTMHCAALTFADEPLGEPRADATPHRASARVQRWNLDKGYGFLVDDNEQHWFFSRTQLVGKADPMERQLVWFVPQSAPKRGGNPVAAAVIAEGDFIAGNLVHSPTRNLRFVKVTDRNGTSQDVFVRRPSAAWGMNTEQRVWFKAVADSRGPVAANVRAEHATHTELPAGFEPKTVSDRFVQVVLDVLRQRNATGALAAVRRMTAHRSSHVPEPARLRYERALHLVDHATRVWAIRGLLAAHAEGQLPALATLGAVRDGDDAFHGAHMLGEYRRRLTSDATTSWGEPISPVLIQVEKALGQIGHIEQDWDSLESRQAIERAVNHCATALCEGFLAGIVGDISDETESVARRLDELGADGLY